MAGRRQFLLGNVPNRISHNARCTVIIVNTGAADGTGAARLVERQRAANRMPRDANPIVRGATIAAVLAKHGVRELFDRHDGDGVDGRRRQAKRLRAALEELGPDVRQARPDPVDAARSAAAGVHRRAFAACATTSRR